MNPGQNSKESSDLSAYRLERISDLEVFIRYDKERYLAFLRRLNETLDALPMGATLTAAEFCPRKQWNLFVKLCCLLSFISKLPSNARHGYTLELSRDYTAITKTGRTPSR